MNAVGVKRCWVCNRFGHLAKDPDCPEQVKLRRALLNKPGCVLCGVQAYHSTSDCVLRHAINRFRDGASVDELAEEAGTDRAGAEELLRRALGPRRE